MFEATATIKVLRSVTLHCTCLSCIRNRCCTKTEKDERIYDMIAVAGIREWIEPQIKAFALSVKLNTEENNGSRILATVV
ncbi:hypothetical protein KIN20_029105 [Parelaphostrongylus tenuis]|uniref:Uncharacterized protein n=1 Tax=Parelaphostrongylus tenuis TaxID=148309 RepID=A0AAD5R223_PARTN|nr:hypothetical protein KIN20_029105 [Parelaphostrongylus tenuis]